MNTQPPSIALNFLPIRSEFVFYVYRSECRDEQEERPAQGVFKYKVPRHSEKDCWPSFWISLSPREGYQKATVQSTDNRFLTIRFLRHLLLCTLEQNLEHDKYFSPENPLSNDVFLVLARRDEGIECVVLRPYYLSINRQFGYLIDFRFKKNEGIPFSREVQRWSLSLDHNYRSNKNCYTDRLQKINSFLKTIAPALNPLSCRELETSMGIGDRFPELKSQLLNVKTYSFRNNKKRNSQFLGVKEFGPLQGPQDHPTFVFVFRDEDRPLARHLVRSLRGKSFPYQFPGMSRMFGLDISNDRIEHTVIREFTKKYLESIIDKIRQIPSALPIIIVPGDKDGYYIQKAFFTNAGIATQCVTTETLRDSRKLQWAVANLALQIFCKAGGKPWKVNPTDSKCLIVGISQSHIKKDYNDPESPILRYFAYSVLTDSSGLFQKIAVLSRATDENSYLSELSSNLSRTINDNIGAFSTVAIHTSFRIRKKEMAAIKNAIQSITERDQSRQPDIAILKVNTENNFFGYCWKHASLVPFESSFVEIDRGEFLVWFEGTQLHNPNISRAISGPTHVKIIFKTDAFRKSNQTLLQDLLNLSGANWRGFNAKSMPVSILYCRLVGRFFGEFDTRDLPQSRMEGFKPWFI